MQNLTYVCFSLFPKDYRMRVVTAYFLFSALFYMLTYFTEVARYESRPLRLNGIYVSVYFGKAPAFSYEVPCVASSSLHIHKRERQAVKQTVEHSPWGTVSRCISQIRFLLWKRKFYCRVHTCHATGSTSETFECLSRLTPNFLKVFPSVVRSPKWSLALRFWPKPCMNYLRLAHLILLGNTVRLKNCVPPVDHLPPETLRHRWRPLLEVFSSVVLGCLDEVLKTQTWSAYLAACSLHAIAGTVCICSDWIDVIDLDPLFKIRGPVKIVPQTEPSRPDCWHALFEHVESNDNQSFNPIIIRQWPHIGRRTCGYEPLPSPFYWNLMNTTVSCDRLIWGLTLWALKC
jgi:hypothetical protein